MTQEKLTKEEQYALGILEAVYKTFDEGDGDFNVDEFKDPENIKRFVPHLPILLQQYFTVERQTKRSTNLNLTILPIH